MDTYNQLLGKIKSSYKGDNPDIKKALNQAKPMEKAKPKEAPRPVPKAVAKPKVTTPAGHSVPLNDRQKYKEVTKQGYAQALKGSAGARFHAGVINGIFPVDTKGAIGQTYGNGALNAINQSKAYSAGNIAGIMGQFAVPYAGAAPAIGKLATKVPQIAKMGKVGQAVARSAATDIAVGLPLNVNYAVNKEGLRGKEAIKSIGVNTAIDLVAGGLIEVVPSGVKGIKHLVDRRTKKVVAQATDETVEAAIGRIVPEPPNQTTPDVIVPGKEGEATIAKVLTSTDHGKRSANNFVSDAYGQVKRKFVDSGDTVAKIAKITKDDVLYPLYNNVKQAWRRGEHMIGAAQTDLSGNQVGKSLKEIFKPVIDKGDDYYRKFQEYAYHMHNIDRMSIVSKAKKTLLSFEAKHRDLMGVDHEDLIKIAKENEAAREYVSLIDSFNKAKDKPVFGDSVTADVSRDEAQRLLRENPEFAKYAEEIYRFNRNNMNYRVEAGLLTKEQADLMMEMYPHYVPTFRSPAGSKGMAVKENVAKIGKTIKAATGSNKDLMPLHESMARQTMQVAESANKNIFANRLANNSRPETSKFIQDIKALEEMFDIDTDLSALPELKNHFTFYKDGTAYSVRVDNSLYEGLKALAPNKDPNALMEAATAVNTGFKQLITSWSPVFLIRNGVRDLQDVGLYSKNLGKFVQKYPTAWREMTTDGDLWKQYKALGGIGSSFFDYAKGFKEDSSWLKKNTLDRIESLNVAIEQLPRFTEFIASVEKNGASYDGLMKAMYDAADVTVNFGRSGTWGKTINSTFVPFFNPAIQGTSKLIRRFTENKSAKDWTVLAIRAAALGVAPSLLNELLYTNDPQYNDIPDRERDINYIFKIGDNEWVKIPKGRVISLFGSPGQRIVRAKNGEGINHMDWLKTMVDQVGPISPFESNIASPIAAVKTNRTWYGTPIEPKRLESFSPGKRADERTTTFARALGEKLGYSPKKIDYLIDAYTGVIGDIAIPAMTPSAERNMISKAFKIDSVMTNKTPQMFYDKVDEVNWAKNDTGAYKYDAMSRYLNKQGGLVSDISSQMREIDGSLTDNKTKREKLREMREASNGIQKMALESLPRVEKAAERLSNKYDDPDDLYREVNRDVFGAEYALKTYDKDVYKKASETVGGKLSYDIYYDVYFDLKDVESDKDKDGKSVRAGSKTEQSGQKQSASVKKRKYIDGIPNLTAQERIRLYDAFEVAKSVREYNIIIPTKK